MAEPLPAMIFAAGRGTRMGALTQHQPKPMIPVASRPLIDHALDIAVTAGLSKVVINTHHCPAPLRAHLASEHRLNLHLVHEDQLLETGGGLRNAAPLFDGAPAVWTLNADAVWRGPNPVRSVPATPVPGGARLLLVPKDRALGHTGPGDFFLNPDGTLRRRGPAPSAPYVYTGVQLIDPAPVAQLNQDAFSLNIVWDAMIARGALLGEVYDGAWCDVGQPESIALAEDLLADV